MKILPEWLPRATRERERTGCSQSRIKKDAAPRETRLRVPHKFSFSRFLFLFFFTFAFTHDSSRLLRISRTDRCRLTLLMHAMHIRRKFLLIDRNFSRNRSKRGPPIRQSFIDRFDNEPVYLSFFFCSLDQLWSPWRGEAKRKEAGAMVERWSRRESRGRGRGRESEIRE